jgi:hypothetical protein
MSKPPCRARCCTTPQNTSTKSSGTWELACVPKTRLAMEGVEDGMKAHRQSSMKGDEAVDERSAPSATVADAFEPGSRPGVPGSVRTAFVLWLVAIAAGVFETALVVAEALSGGSIPGGSISTAGLVAGVGVRLLVFAVALYVSLRMGLGKNWARLTLLRSARRCPQAGSAPRPGGDVARVPRVRIGQPEELPVLRRGVPDRRDPGDALLVGGAYGYELVRVDDPPSDRPEPFAFRRHIFERPASAPCNERTTSAPSPTADATRFVEPLRTSPMAKTSGRVVSRSNGWPPLPSRCSAKLG